MSTKRDGKGRPRLAARRGFAVESLERRALLASASETFTGPSLTSLINQAEHGKNTTPAIINTMITALQSQLESGPLADLTSGAVTDNGFIAESQALEASYEVNVDQQLLARFPGTDELLKLQGQGVVASLVSLNQEESVGLLSSSGFVSAAQSSITALTKGPILALGTKPAALTSLTKTFTGQLATLVQDLGNGSLTLGPATITLEAEAEAYRAEVHAGIQTSQVAISSRTDFKINALENTAISIESTAPGNASTQLATAIKTFDSQVLDTNGFFGPKGALAHAKTPKFNPKQTQGQLADFLKSVSATETTTGATSLTATLGETDNSPINGQAVAFTVDGAFVGLAFTDFHGVAILTGPASTDAVGLDTGGVVVSTLGNINYLPTASDGNLTVRQAPSVMSNVAGTAVYGGTATLTAMLTAQSTGAALSGQTVTFMLDGVVAGTAVTNAAGVATLSGVATIDSAGTDTNGIIAEFAGNATQAAAAANGSLVVSQAGATLSEVSGSASIGGTATLVATLTSNVTGQGVSGQTVSFTLNGKSVGTEVTNSNGVAMLTGVATTAALGTDTNGVVASFSGSTNFTAATSVTGNLVVSKADTELTNVSGTAVFGGTATLTATLNSAATAGPISGQTIDFSLDDKSVGSAVTDSNGVASLSGIATNQGVGTDTNGVVATFAGSTNYSPSTLAGNLVVSAEATSLSGVAGTAFFGGPATLTATLNTSDTSQPIIGQLITFELNGTSVGTALTNANGVATLTGVTANDAVGTSANAITASFSGSTQFSNAIASGNLVISKAATTLSSVSGSATYGGTGTLVATLDSSVTCKGISGEPVSFTLDGTTEGSAITNSSGVATLSGFRTTKAAGTDSGGVVASFIGDDNFLAPTSTSGDFVVSQAPTQIIDVSGTAPVGGPATLMAMLQSTVTLLPIANETITFTLDKTVVGHATTNGDGIATLHNVPTTDAAGTDTGGVIANFGGDTNQKSSQGSGNLVVS